MEQFSGGCCCNFFGCHLLQPFSPSVSIIISTHELLMLPAHLTANANFAKLTTREGENKAPKTYVEKKNWTAQLYAVVVVIKNLLASAGNFVDPKLFSMRHIFHSF